MLKEPEDRYSLHSLRQGGAMLAFQSNMENEMIKLLGDWASDAYRKYCDVSIDKRFDSMQAFVNALNKVTTDNIELGDAKHRKITSISGKRKKGGTNTTT